MYIAYTLHTRRINATKTRNEKNGCNERKKRERKIRAPRLPPPPSKQKRAENGGAEKQIQHTNYKVIIMDSDIHICRYFTSSSHTLTRTHCVHGMYV